MSKKNFLIIFIAFISCTAFCLDVPRLRAHINDYAKIINKADEQEAEKYLSDLETTTGIQIAVLTVPSLKGEYIDISSFANKVAETWKLGQEKKDNGALLVVALAERKVRIEVGYGLEDKLTDAKCGLIIRNVIIPEFQKGNYSQGILLGLQNIGGIASDNASLVSKKVLSGKDSDSGLESLAFAIVFFVAWFILFSGIASGRHNHWLPWIILSNGFRSSNRGGRFYSGSSRGSGFGGSSSIFKGGGGHFGGGGASGGW